MWLAHMLEMTECHFGPTGRDRPLLSRAGGQRNAVKYIIIIKE